MKGWALAALLICASCTRVPDSYPPPPQRIALSGPEPIETRSVLLTSDVDASKFILKGVLPADGPGPWRWTSEHVAFRLAPTADLPQELFVQIIVVEVTLKQTGPITIKACINNTDLGSRRFTVPGEALFAVPVPEKFAKSGVPETVSIEIDPPYISPEDQNHLGVLIHSIGFRKRVPS